MSSVAYTLKVIIFALATGSAEPQPAMVGTIQQTFETKVECQAAGEDIGNAGVERLKNIIQAAKVPGVKVTGYKVECELPKESI